MPSSGDIGFASGSNPLAPSSGGGRGPVPNQNAPGGFQFVDALGNPLYQQGALYPGLLINDAQGRPVIGPTGLIVGYGPDGQPLVHYTGPPFQLEITGPNTATITYNPPPLVNYQGRPADISRPTPARGPNPITGERPGGEINHPTLSSGEVDLLNPRRPAAGQGVIDMGDPGNHGLVIGGGRSPMTQGGAGLGEITDPGGARPPTMRPQDPSGGLGNSPAPPEALNPNSPQTGLPKPPPPAPAPAPAEPPAVAPPVNQGKPPPPNPQPAPPVEPPPVQLSPNRNPNGTLRPGPLQPEALGPGRVPPLAGGGLRMPLGPPLMGMPNTIDPDLRPAPDGTGRPDLTNNPPNAIGGALQSLLSRPGAMGGVVTLDPNDVRPPRPWYDANNPATWMPGWRPDPNHPGLGTFDSPEETLIPSPTGAGLAIAAGIAEAVAAAAAVAQGSGIELTANPNPASGAQSIVFTVVDKGGVMNAGAPGETWDFDFGDGVQNNVNLGNTASHSYSTPGSYAASATVHYTNGKTDTATVQVTVNNPVLTP